MLPFQVSSHAPVKRFECRAISTDKGGVSLKNDDSDTFMFNYYIILSRAHASTARCWRLCGPHLYLEAAPPKVLRELPKDNPCILVNTIHSYRSSSSQWQLIIRHYPYTCTWVVHYKMVFSCTCTYYQILISDSLPLLGLQMAALWGVHLHNFGHLHNN